jgi:hypothetical protein
MKPPRAGETVGLRRGQNSQPAGLHLVREVLEDGRLAVTSWITQENFTVPIEDIVGWDGEAVTLAPRPPQQRVAAPAPETKPEPLVTISLPDPNRQGYSFPLRGDTDPVVFVPYHSAHLNHNRVSDMAIDVPESLVNAVLVGVDGSHEVGGRPQPPVDAFGEED